MGSGLGVDGAGKPHIKGLGDFGAPGAGVQCSDGWDLAVWEKGSPGGPQPVG